MQIGRLTWMLGMSGIILITAAWNFNIGSAEEYRGTPPDSQPARISLFTDQRLPHRNGPEGQVIRKRNLPWMPDPMKVLVRSLGNG